MSVAKTGCVQIEGGGCCSLELSAHRHLLSVFSPRCRSWTFLLLIEAGSGIVCFCFVWIFCIQIVHWSQKIAPSKSSRFKTRVLQLCVRDRRLSVLSLRIRSFFWNSDCSMDSASYFKLFDLNISHEWHVVLKCCLLSASSTVPVVLSLQLMSLLDVVCNIADGVGLGRFWQTVFSDVFFLEGQMQVKSV